jgi:glycine betaine/proline transport system ATP-binding protein
MWEMPVKKAIVFITHDLDEALRRGDQIAILRDGELIQQGTSQDILLRPADEYVTRFVREVNRGRFIHAEAAMTPLAPGQPASPLTIAATATLDDAAHLISRSSEETLAIVDEDGKSSGRLT